MHSDTDTTPATVHLMPWTADPAHYDPLGPYLETAWLPILGPTSCWLYRRLVTETPGTINCEEVAWSLGLQSGAKAPFTRAMRRLAQFGLIRWQDPGEVEVRLSLPPLTNRQLDRLAPAVTARICERSPASSS